jgi:hypothetical protein
MDDDAPRGTMRFEEALRKLRGSFEEASRSDAL